MCDFKVKKKINFNNIFSYNCTARVVVVRMEGEPELCKIDQVGELCIHAYTTGISFFGLAGRTNNTFKVQRYPNLLIYFYIMFSNAFKCGFNVRFVRILNVFDNKLFIYSLGATNNRWHQNK